MVQEILQRQKRVDVQLVVARQKAQPGEQGPKGDKGHHQGQRLADPVGIHHWRAAAAGFRMAAVIHIVVVFPP